MTRRSANVDPAPPPPPLPMASSRQERARMVSIALGVSGFGAALALYAMPVFILVYGGLMPAIFALVMDERQGRHLTVTVASFNGAGVMIGLGPMFAKTLSDTAAYQIVASPETWLFIYGFALAGWALAWVMPLFVSQGLELVDRQRCRAIELAREAIVRQWPSIGAGRERDALDDDPFLPPPDAVPEPRRSRSTSA